MGRGGWLSENGTHDLPHLGYVIQSLQAKPEGLGARFAIALAGKKATEHGHHSGCFPQGRRLFDRFLGDERSKRSPLRFFEVHGAWNIRGFPAQFSEVVNSPRHD